MRAIVIAILALVVWGCGGSTGHSKPQWAQSNLVESSKEFEQTHAPASFQHEFLDNFDSYLPQPVDDPNRVARETNNCSSGNEVACMMMAVRYYEGISVSQDKIMALNWFIKACDTRHEEACSWAGAMYYHGWGVSVDKTEALRWFERGCDADNEEDCSRAASLLLSGEAGPPNEDRALDLLSRGCDLNFAELCEIVQKHGRSPSGFRP